jgi:hypothetical protein
VTEGYAASVTTDTGDPDIEDTNLRTPIAKSIVSYLKQQVRSARRHSGRAHACWAGINTSR